MAGVGASPFSYTIKQSDLQEPNGTLYFACSIGAHCSKDAGSQKIQIQLEPNQVQAMEDNKEHVRKPTSHTLFGLSAAECAEIQE